MTPAERASQADKEAFWEDNPDASDADYRAYVRQTAERLTTGAIRLPIPLQTAEQDIEITVPQAPPMTADELRDSILAQFAEPEFTPAAQYIPRASAEVQARNTEILAEAARRLGLAQNGAA